MTKAERMHRTRKKVDQRLTQWFYFNDELEPGVYNTRKGGNQDYRTFGRLKKNKSLGCPGTCPMCNWYKFKPYPTKRRRKNKAEIEFQLRNF